MEFNDVRSQQYLHVFYNNKENLGFLQANYSKVQDVAQIYKMRTKIASTKQGNRSVTEHAHMLQNLWQELDPYQ